jgi:hypothetical protein
MEADQLDFQSFSDAQSLKKTLSGILHLFHKLCKHTTNESPTLFGVIIEAADRLTCMKPETAQRGRGCSRTGQSAASLDRGLEVQSAQLLSKGGNHCVSWDANSAALKTTLTSWQSDWIVIRSSSVILRRR